MICVTKKEKTIINVAEILKNKPVGTELYSSLCDDCKLHKVHEDGTIEVTDVFDNIFPFDEYGLHCINGDTYYLYPSEKEKSWENAIKEKIKTIPLNNMINIAEILKDCPSGIKLYSPVFGECALNKVLKDDGTIQVYIDNGKSFDSYFGFNKYGHLHFDGGECLLFPSKDNRDWSTFKETASCPFKPFDKVVVRFKYGSEWHAAFFSDFCPSKSLAQYHTTADGWYFDCLPYNEETVKLIGTDNDYEYHK